MYRTIQCLEKNVHKRTKITYADGRNGCKDKPNKKQTYSDFYSFYQFSNDDIRIKIEKLKPKWKRIINKLENKQL